MQSETTDGLTFDTADFGFGGIKDSAEEDLELLDVEETLEESIAQLGRSGSSGGNKIAANSDREVQTDSPPTVFHNHYVGYMDLCADAKTVMGYLDTHQGWFRRCAHPLKADPICENGYALGVGRVGAFGFSVDPRIGLDLLPQESGIYRINTIPIPDREPQNYEVDFHAVMSLVEKPIPTEKTVGFVVTSVEWQLDLTVKLQFPKFIHAMPHDLIKRTGDGLLGLVVKRVSKSLTDKVQSDFHKSIGVSALKKRLEN